MPKKLYSILVLASLYATGLWSIERPKNVTELNAALAKAEQEGKPAAIKFYAEWCGHCKKISHLFGDLEKKHGGALYIEVEADKPEFAEEKKKYGVTGYPTIVIMSSEGKKTIKGPKQDEIKSAVVQAIKEHKKGSPAKSEKKVAQAPTKKAEPEAQPAQAKKTPASSAVHHPTTKAQLDTLISDAQTEKKAIAIKFTTSWCTYCKYIANLFNDLSKELGNVVFIELDGDNQEFAAEKKKHGVTGYPTTVIINTVHASKEVIPGAAEAPIKQAIRNAAAGKKGMSQAAMASTMKEPKEVAKKQQAEKQKPMSRKEKKEAAKAEKMMPKKMVN